MGYVFVEIDMRNDFADDPRAILPVPGTYALVGRMRVLEESSALLIEAYDDHTGDDPVSKEEFKSFPPHCVPGTWGHKRIAGLFSSRNPRRHWKFRKNSYDAWKGIIQGSAKDRKEVQSFERVLAKAERIVVGGVVTGICVKAFMDGVISRGFAGKTTVISDCIANLEAVSGVPKTKDCYEEWKKAGARVMTFEEFIKETMPTKRCNSME